MASRPVNSTEYSTMLTNLFNCVPYPVFCKDRQHRFVSLNDIECEYLGYSRDEMIGKSDSDFFPQEQCEVFWSVDDDVLNSAQIITNDEVITDSFGVVHQLRTKKGRISMPDGEELLVGISYVLDDASLVPQTEDDDQIFNAGTLSSIESLSQTWSRAKKSDSDYLRFKTSEITKLFLHDQEFLREFLSHIPFNAYYVDHSSNIVCANKQLQSLVNIEERVSCEALLRHSETRDLFRFIGGKRQYQENDSPETIIEKLIIENHEHVICLSQLPVIGITGRLHGVLNIFDLLKLDVEKGVNFEFYRKSSLFNRYETVVCQVRDCLHNSASTVFKLATQDTANLEIRSIEQLADITRISSEYAQKLDKLLAKRGISLKEWQVLNIVINFVYPTPSIIGKKLGVSNSAVSKMLDVMETKGLIERRRSRQEDRRKIRLWYTEAGYLAWLYGNKMTDHSM